MNRRAFLGFACGGVVAAPAAVLMGEKANAFPHRALVCPSGQLSIVADNFEAAGERHQRMMAAIEEEITKAMREAERRIMRGGRLGRSSYRNG